MKAIKILLLLLISKFEIILWLVVASGHDAQCTPIASYTKTIKTLLIFKSCDPSDQMARGHKEGWSGWGFQASSSGNWWLWTVDSGQTTWPTKSSSGNWWARVLARGHWPHKPRGQKISSDSWWSIKNINNKSGSLVVDKENRNNKSGSRRSIYGRWQWASIKQQKVPELTNLRKVWLKQKR